MCASRWSLPLFEIIETRQRAGKEHLPFALQSPQFPTQGGAAQTYGQRHADNDEDDFLHWSHGGGQESTRRCGQAARLQNSLQISLQTSNAASGRGATRPGLISLVCLKARALVSMAMPSAGSAPPLPRERAPPLDRCAPRFAPCTGCRCRAALRPQRRHAPKPEGPHEAEVPRRPRLLRRTRRSQWAALAAKLMRRRSGSTSR